MSVSQLKLGFCVSQYWNHPTGIGKGSGPAVPFEVVVAARLSTLAPGSSPYQRCFPSTIGPSQIFSITAASVSVIVPHGVTSPTNLNGLKWHAAGFSITPDLSAHAAITAFVNAVSLQLGRKSLLRSMTSSGQSSDGMNFVQLIAGEPDTMPL